MNGYSVADIKTKKLLGELFNSNMSAFERYLPDIYNKFKSYIPKRQACFAISDITSDVNLIVDESSTVYPHDAMNFCMHEVDAFLKSEINLYKFIRQEDKYGQFHYKYENDLADSVAELQRHMAFTPSETGSLGFLCIFGVGLGYHLPYLLSKIEIANLIITESSEDIFYCSLYTVDWASLLKYISDSSMGFELIVGVDSQEMIQSISSYCMKRGYFLTRGYSSYMHGTDRDNLALKEAADSSVKYMHLSLGFLDDRLFGISHASKALCSKLRLYKKDENTPPSIKTPLFIIASGPSLDNDLDFIAKNQDKVISIACGSAIEILYRRGIVPDFFATTERTYELSVPLSYFDREFLDKITLISSEVVHPAITALFKQHLIFLKNDESIFYLFMQDKKYYDLVKNWGVLHLINPLVANCAASAALALGFKNIYLFGVDNGVADKGLDAAHSKGSYMYGLNLKNVQGDEVNTASNMRELMAGNFGGMVRTDTVYRQSASNIEVLIEHYQKKFENAYNICNCSDGLAIKGARPCTKDSICFDTEDRKQALDSIMQKSFFYEIDEGEIKDLIDIELYESIIDNIINRLDRAESDRFHIMLCMQEISSYLQSMLVTHECFYAALIEGSIHTFFVQIQYLLYTTADEKRALMLASRGFEYLRLLLCDSKRLILMLPDYVQHDHLELLGSTIGFEHENSVPLRDFKEYNIFTKDVRAKLEANTHAFVKRY